MAFGHDRKGPGQRGPRPQGHERGPRLQGHGFQGHGFQGPRKAKAVTRPGQIQIFGFHSVTARLHTAPHSFVQLWLDPAREDPRARELSRLAGQHGIAVQTASAPDMERMAPGRRHQGVIAQVSASWPDLDVPQVLERARELQEDPLLLLLDGVTDPRNLGACLRVADGAGAHAVIAPRDHSCGLTEAAIHTSSGAAESVPFVSVSNLSRTIEDLQEAGVRVIGTADEADDDVHSVDLSGPIAWVLGSEDKGIRRLVREHCDLLVRIPMAGQCESLNVAVAAGVLLYETRRIRGPVARRQQLVAGPDAAPGPDPEPGPDPDSDLDPEPDSDPQENPA